MVPPVPLPKPIAETIQTVKDVNGLQNPSAMRHLLDAEEAPLGTKIGSVGTMKILVVLVKTSAAATPFARDYVQNLFFGHLLGNTNLPQSCASLADYYQAASGGKLNITGDVLDWITLDSSDQGWTDFSDAGLISRIADQASRKVPLAPYDNDDLSGNGSSPGTDGNVDFFVIIYAASPAEKSGFAYRYKYSLCANGPGTPWKPSDPNYGAVGIEDYLFVPSFEITNYDLGVIAHETGHFLGLPDLYKRGNYQLPTDMGHWCIMCWGCRNVGVPTAPLFGSARFPPLPSAWCRDFLGWGQPVYGRPGVRVYLNSARLGNYAVLTGFGDPDEKLLVELYTPPTDASPWGRGILPATNSGFLVWHVDNKVGNTPTDGVFAWPASELGAGENDSVFDPASFTSDPGSRYSPSGRPLVRLVTADGMLSLENTNDMLPHASQMFGNTTVGFTNLSEGFGFYRATAPATFNFDLSDRYFTMSGVSSNPAPVAASAPLAAPTAASSPPLLLGDSSFLNSLAKNTNLLVNPGVKSRFLSMEADDVDLFAKQHGLPELEQLQHQERTFDAGAFTTGPVTSPVHRAQSAVQKFIGDSRAETQFTMSEDGHGLEEVNTFLPLHGTSPLEDGLSRSNELKNLFNAQKPGVALVLGSDDSGAINRQDINDVPFRFKAKVGDLWLPIAFAHGYLHYTNQMALKSVNIVKPADLSNLPASAEPLLSATKAISSLEEAYQNRFPEGTKFSASLEIFPKSSTNNVLAYRVAVAMPLARPIYGYIDANTGDRLYR